MVTNVNTIWRRMRARLCERTQTGCACADADHHRGSSESERKSPGSKRVLVVRGQVHASTSIALICMRSAPTPEIFYTLLARRLSFILSLLE